MVYKKKINFQTVALVVVSVLLAISTVVTGTMAWFASQDSANNTVTLGSAIVMTIDEGGAGAGQYPLVVNGEAAIPGTKVSPTIIIDFQGNANNNTMSLLRVRLSQVTVDTTNSLVPATVTAGTAAVTASITTSINTAVNDAWVLYDGWFYFVGDVASASAGAYVMTTTDVAAATGIAGYPGSPAVVADTNSGALYVPTYARTEADETDGVVLASVNPGTLGTSINFFNSASQYFLMPYDITNDWAGTVITLTFEAEAIQDLLISTDNTTILPPTVLNASTLFDLLP